MAKMFHIKARDLILNTKGLEGNFDPTKEFGFNTKNLVYSGVKQEIN